VGKKTNKKTIIENVFYRLYFSPVHINGIGQGLESKKRNTYGQQQLIYPECGTKKRVRKLSKVIDVGIVASSDLI
jgi:hypothetical protein